MSLVICFNLPKLIINKFFKKVFPLPPFDCLSSYEKVISRNVYASKIKEIKDLPFTIIADESTDPYSNQEILS